MSTWHRSHLLFAIAFCAPSAHAQHWFDTARMVVEPQKGEIQGIGDLNGDGHKDLVVADGVLGLLATWSGLHSALNDGVGRFVNGPTQALPGPDYSPRKLPVVDFDGDGFGDVIFEKTTTPFSLMIYRSTGAGSFAAPIGVALPARLESIAVGDSDGDGDFEFATVTRSSALSNADFEVRWWNANGATFVASTALVLPASSYSGGSPSSLVALDVNADGLDDLAVGSASNGSVNLLISQSGAPTLGPTLVAPFGFPRIIVGDLEGDGDSDMLAYGFAPGLMTANFVQTSPLVFSISAASSLSLPQGELPQFLADWDDDGDADLLASSSGQNGGTSTLVAFEQTSSAFAFASRSIVSETSLSTGNGAGVVDFDLDGSIDYVGPSGILFGVGEFLNILAPLGPLSLIPLDGRFADFDDDGDLDILRTTMGGPFYGGGPIYANDAGGQYDDALLSLPAPPIGMQWGSGAGNSSIHAIGDFVSGPGIDALVTVYSISTSAFDPPIFKHVRLLLNDELGHWIDGGVAASTWIAPSKLDPADVDADGDLDVVGSINSFDGGFWLNAGNGTFGAYQQHFQGEPRVAFDADLDGDMDFITIAGASALMIFERNDGASFTSIALTSTPNNSLAPHAIDLDQDGDRDLIYVDNVSTTKSLVLLRNDLAAGFSLVSTLPTDASSFEHFAFADVTGDGIRDLVAATESSLRRRIGVFAGTATAFVCQPLVTYYGSAIDLGDIDQDGDIDAVASGRIHGRLFHGSDDGFLRQYGVRSSGTGGAKPVLGGTGPVRPGSTTASLRVRLGLGGAPAFFLIGFGETSLPGFGVPGFTLQVSPLYNVISVPLAGASGVPGQGSFDFPTAPLIPAVVGLSIFHQFAILDPGAQSSVSFTNGLEIHYGL